MTVVLTGSNLPLRQGVRYRARARVDSPRLLTPTSSIKAFFEDVGFGDVVVITEARALPADWPGDQRSEIPSGGLGGWTVFLEGTWSLMDQGLPRPEPLLAVWVADQASASSGPGVVTLPEITIVGDVPPSRVTWKVGVFLVGTAAAILLTALRWGKPVE